MIEEPVKYITKVEIRGLFGRYDIEWNLHPDVNVLSGINGSGKTTLLDCIFGLLNKGELPDNHQEKFEKIQLIFNNGKYIEFKKLRINGTRKILEQRAKTDTLIKNYLIGLKEQKPKEYKKIHFIEFEALRVSFENLGLTVSELNELINIDSIKTFDNKLKPLETIQKFSADDNVETDLDFSIYQLQKAYVEYQLNLFKRIQSISDVNEIQKITQIKTRFLEILNQLFSETGKSADANENKISFLLNDQKINAYQLSSGEKQLLIILMTALMQNKKSSILLMDEPEISLHIDWQEKLISYIRELNPNAQLIITTHSPGIIMEGWFDKVFELSDLTVKDRLKS